jgi:hypothetical protein
MITKKFKLEIEMDGDAFVGDGKFELARLLREVASSQVMMGDQSGVIVDGNGNAIGSFEIVERHRGTKYL